MTSPDHEAALARVFSEVLEQLAFMFADPPEKDNPQIEENLAVASMTFRGPQSGSMSLAVPRPMAELLAANVLGMDPGEVMPPNAPGDALKELLNVTCGNVLTAIAGEEPVFDLSVPEIRECGADEWTALRRGANTIYVLVEEFPVLLNLDISGAP